MREHVLIIGGGVIGLGIAWDLTLRGIGCVLVERDDLCAGTTGRCHGLLHGGGRYAVSDPTTARACAEENRILRRTAGPLVEEYQGLFVALESDPEEYREQFAVCARDTGVRTEMLDTRDIIERSPLISNKVVAGFMTDDAAIDPFALVYHLARSADERGAHIINHAEVIELKEGEAKIRHRDGSIERVGFDICVDATGPWIGKTSSPGEAHVQLAHTRGTMLVFSERIFDGVVHRLRPPSDGDIFVPNQTATIFGTTSVPVDDDGFRRPSPSIKEIELLVREAADLCPTSGSMRIIRSYSGVRSLITGISSPEPGRQMARAHLVRDLGNLVLVAGGKLTTFRLIAEEAADLVCRKLGVRARCTTATEPIIEPGETYPGLWSAAAFVDERVRSRHGGSLATSSEGPIICPCEGIRTSEVALMVRTGWVRSLDDLRRRTRLGNGSCQGTRCASCAVAVLLQELQGSECGIKGSFYDPVEDLSIFLASRLRGGSLTHNENQMRQLMLLYKTYTLTGGIPLTLQALRTDEGGQEASEKNRDDTEGARQ